MGDTWADVIAQHKALAGTATTNSPGPGRGGRTPPPTVKPEGFLHGVARETVNSLPAIGMTVGGAVVTPADVITFGVPVGTAAGALVGGGVGSAIQQTMLNWFPSLGQAPKTTQDAVMETGKQMLIGGATEGLNPAIENAFEMVAPVASRALKSVGSTVDLASQKLKQSAVNKLVSVMKPQGEVMPAVAEDAAKALLSRSPKEYLAVTRGQFFRRAVAKQQASGKALAVAEKQVSDDIIDADLVNKTKQSIDAYRATLFGPPIHPAGVSGPVIVQGLYTDPKLKVINEIEQDLDARFPAVRNNPALVSADNPNGAELVPGTGQLSRGSLRFSKQQIDNNLREIGAFSKGVASKSGLLDAEQSSAVVAKRKMADVFRDTLNEDKPDIAKLNNDYHLMTQVVDSMSKSVFKEGKEAPPSLWQEAWHARFLQWLAKAGPATALIGGATHYEGGDAKTMASVTGAMLALTSATRTTAWKTVSAATKSKIADALASRNFEEVAKLATEAAIKSSNNPIVKSALTPATRAALRPNPPVANDKAVKMKTPDGKVWNIPVDQVDEAKKRGATVIQ